MIDGKALFTIVAQMGGMKFFPADEHARIGIAKQMASMCQSIEQAEWLSTRLQRLFSEGWPGVGEMRAVFCSKYRPLDGAEVHSRVFLEGVPSEVPGRDDEMAGYLPATSKRLQLAAGEVPVISASPSIQSTLEALREAKALRRIGQAPLVPSIPVVKVTIENAITEADFEKLLEGK